MEVLIAALLIFSGLMLLSISVDKIAKELRRANDLKANEQPADVLDK